MRQKNVSQNNQLQEFITTIIELKNESVNNLKNITRKKNVSQDNQLQEFISKIVDLKNQISSHEIETFIKKRTLAKITNCKNL